jgi:MerR family transcriptional regulator, copper efflux regulator
MDMMRISQLAERSGVPASTLRFYEAEGLLPAARTMAGYRAYGDDAVERLGFIGAAKHLGLPLSEIRDLLEVWQAGSCAQVRADLRPRLTARLEQAEERTAELGAFSAMLRNALGHLDALPDRPGRCDPGCGFLTGTPPARGSGGHPPAPGPGAAGQHGGRSRPAPVACSLPAIEKADRAAGWRKVTSGATADQIPGGLRLTLPAGRAAAVAGLAAAEQDCCPFLDFRIHLDGPVLRLEVRAPAAAAGVLVGLFTPVPA